MIQSACFYTGWRLGTGDFESISTNSYLKLVILKNPHFVPYCMPFHLQWCGPVFTAKAYWKNDDTYEAARQEFRRHFQLGRHDPVPSAHAIKTWIRKLKTTGSALNERSPGPRRTVRTSERVQVVNAAMQLSLHRSARRNAVSLDLSRRTLGRILFSNFKLNPYKQHELACQVTRFFHV